MSISSTDRVAGPFAGNGSTTQFPFSFKVFKPEDLEVAFTSTQGAETTLTLGAGYTVTINADQETAPGGVVSIIGAAPAEGTLLTITSDLPALQPVVLTNLGKFLPDVINNALDRLTILIQQLKGGLSRCLQFPLSDAGTSFSLPAAAGRSNALFSFDAAGAPSMLVGTPGTVLGFESGGKPVSVVPTEGTAGSLALLLAGSGVGEGAGMVGYKGRSAADRLSETVSLIDFGAADDWTGSEGTNNLAAFEAAFALAPVRIHLPNTNTGVYMIDGLTAVTAGDGVVLDPAPGVSIHIKAGASTPTTAPGVRTTRTLDNRFAYGSGMYKFSLRPELRRPPGEQRPMSALDGELHVPIALDFADAEHVQVSAWPSGGLVDVSPSVSAASVTHTSVPAGTFVGSLFHVLPGDSLCATTNSGGFIPAILLRTVAGWAMLRQQGDSYSLTLTETSNGSTVETEYIDAVLSAETYIFKNSSIGIRLNDWNSFSLLVNGVAIRRVTLGSQIVSAGWAAGFGSGAFTISNPVAWRGKHTTGIKPLKIVCIGDSTSDPGAPQSSQYHYMRQCLTGASGCQVDTLNIIARSGETSAQQLARLQAEDLTGYDLCLIQIGINDVQTGAGAATLISNVEAMCTLARAAGVEPIVGLPTMWYSNADALANGQDASTTVNCTLAAGYRQALLRRMGELGVYVNTMPQDDEGAVTAQLISTAGAETVLYDNIHPDGYGVMLMGYAWAKAVAAWYTTAAQRTLANPTVPAGIFSAGWGATARPEYSVQGGCIRLSYYVSAANLTDYTVIATLPERWRPRAEIAITAMCMSAGAGGLVPLGVCVLLIDPVGGNVLIIGAAAGTAFVSMHAEWEVA